MPFVKKYAKKSTAVRSKSKPEVVSMALYRKLQAMIPKPEIKRFATILTGGSSFGQLDGLFAGDANSGHLIAAVTPNPLIGAGVNERIGAQMNIKSLAVRGQVYGQSGHVGPSKVRLIGIRVKGANYATSALALTASFYPNPVPFGAAQSIYDYQSLKQLESTGLIDFMFDKTLTIGQDGATGAGFVGSSNITIDVEKDMLVAYDISGLIVLKGAMYFICFADRGNKSNSFAAGLVTGVVDTAVSTGVNIACSFEFKYTDN